MNKTDSTVLITPKLILIFLVSIGTPTASGIWFLSETTSRLSSLEDSISSMPSNDNSNILERITAVEINSKNNLDSIGRLDADVDKIVEHVDKSFKQVTDSMNSNPLSLGN
jgi:hypothetical protein